MTANRAAGAQAIEGCVVDEALGARLVAELQPIFAGQLVRPRDQDYDDARRVWNAMIDKRPGLIARCRCVEDVVAVVNAARKHHLKPSIRGGGHAVSGTALSDAGLTIDLSAMRAVTVDVANKVAHAQGGALLADLDAVTAEHALIVPAGIVSETGVAGLALGGGVGWLSRKHGLTCDNFESLEVVLANGDVVEASPTQHPDLFWALRGGGGNFGVVTRFSFRAHDFGPMIRLGIALYRPQDAAQALREYARIMPTLPSTVGWHGSLKRHMPAQQFVPPELVGQRLLMLLSMWLDDADDPEGIAMAERLNHVGRPCHTVTTVIPFGLGMQRVLDQEFPAGHRYYTKQAPIAELADEAIDIVVDFWTTMPMNGDIAIASLAGAIAEVPEDNAAFSHRQYLWWLTFEMQWDDPALDEEYIAQTRAVAARIQPWTGHGLYMNMMSLDESDRVIEGFGGQTKYAKLGRIKAKYDPTNLFQVNYNITPVFDA